MTTISFNANRVYQATAMLPYLLQDQLGPNEHRVLVALAARMAYKSGPTTKTLVDTCFPTLMTISRDTLLSDRAVRYALDELIGNGYVTKSKMPGTRIRRGDKVWKFKHNRYHLVPELWDSVGSLYGSKTDEAQLSVAVGSQPLSGSPHLEGGADNNLKGAPTPEYPETEAILALLRTTFSSHPTWATPGGDAIMRNAVRACIDAAGSGEYCRAVFEDLCSNPELKPLRAAIAKSAKLGGYLKRSFPGWISNDTVPVEEDMADEAAHEGWNEDDWYEEDRNDAD